MNIKMKLKYKSILYGMLAGVGLLLFYLGFITFFQGFNLALLNFKSLWFWIVPLTIGFGTQIGLYTSIKHTALTTGTVTGTGAISGGSMIACCSHFLFNMVPFLGLGGVAIFLTKYQTAFLGVGIISNIVGITFMLNHKNKMKGGSC